MALELVETIEVGSGGAASIEFTSIPQTGVDLLIMVSTRRSSNNEIGYLQFNGDGGAGNHDTVWLEGDGSTATTSSLDSTVIRFDVTRNDATANTFGNASIYVSNYTSSSAKSVSIDSVGENNGTTAYSMLSAGSWSGTTAITSLELIYGQVEYSTASLYIIS